MPVYDVPLKIFRGAYQLGQMCSTLPRTELRAHRSSAHGVPRCEAGVTEILVLFQMSLNPECCVSHSRKSREIDTAS